LVDLATALLAGMAAMGFPQAFPAPLHNTLVAAAAPQTIQFLPVLGFLAAVTAGAAELPARPEQLTLAAAVVVVDLAAAEGMAVQAL
jgi:hypothetical protein